MTVINNLFIQYNHKNAKHWLVSESKNIQKYKSTEEIVFTDKGFVPNEQTKISDKKISSNEDLD